MARPEAEASRWTGHPRQCRYGGERTMRAIAIGVVLSTGLVTGPAEAQLIACEQVEARWRNATATTSLAEWTAIYDEAHNESDCGGDVVEQIGLDIIALDIIAKELEAIERTYASSDGDATLRGLLGRLDILQGFASHWRVSFLRGDMYRKLRDPRRAFEAYRDSLGLVDDEELTATAPPFATIALLRDRLDEAAVIVAQVEPAAIKLPVTRSGELISQYSFTTRGYTRKKALVPIQFIYAKDTMTDTGRSSFEDALQTLVRQGSPDIRVVGHTDPVGSAAYNRNLSIDRACAVRRALMEESYRGEVEAVGMGEEQPFQFDDPGLYSEEHRHQAHRRVELILRRGTADGQGRSEPCRG